MIAPYTYTHTDRHTRTHTLKNFNTHKHTCHQHHQQHYTQTFGTNSPLHLSGYFTWVFHLGEDFKSMLKTIPLLKIFQNVLSSVPSTRKTNQTATIQLSTQHLGNISVNISSASVFKLRLPRDRETESINNNKINKQNKKQKRNIGV